MLHSHINNLSGISGELHTARLAHLINRNNHIDFKRQLAQTTYTIVIDSWTWWRQSTPAFWVGRLDGPKIEDGNVVIFGEGWQTPTCYRLEGNYDLYLIHQSKTQTTTLIVDTKGERLDHGVLGTDFRAMEFAVGRPCRLERMLAIDACHEVVGAAGLGFTGRSAVRTTARCPVACSRDIYANYGELDSEHIWVPALFSLTAKRLHQEGPDSALLTAISAYLDSITAANIHVSYLLVQVALEALSAELVKPTSSVLVSSPKGWEAFVREQEATIRTFAIDEAAAQKLVNKVISAQQSPSTDRVSTALRHFKLDVPQAALKEIQRRNPSAHSFIMAKESTADAQNLADRLAMVQTLLVAVVAKHIGFKGPIIGWEWIKGRHKIPEWWPRETVDAASRHYVILPPNANDAHQGGEREG